MKGLIYGAGAVGCYLGGHLALVGHDITLLGRDKLVHRVQADDLTLRLADGSEHTTTVKSVTSIEEALNGEGDFDWIAFTMKSYDTVPAIFDLQYQLQTKPPPSIITFQNGVGNTRSLSDAFGPDAIAAGTMTTAVSMPEPGIVIEERRRGVAIAADSPASKIIFNAFAPTKLNVQPIDNWQSLKWSKLLLNMTANTVCAILDQSPQEIYQDRRLFAIERAAFVETLYIMELLDIPLVDLPNSPVKLLVTAMRRLPPVVSRPLLQSQIGSGRGGKPPSLLLDLRAERRKTEVAWLNGAVVQAADQLERLAPINHTLALTLSDITAGRTSWDMYRHNPEMLLTAIRVATQS